MRTLVIAAVAVAMSFGGSAADAQRLGNGGAPGGAWRGGSPPQGQPMPRPNPGQWQGPRPGNPGGWNGNGPRPRPGNPGNWNGPRPGTPGNWNNGGQWRKGWTSSRSRWGNRVGGYWWAGVQAPGGWNGYSRIKRGKRIPNYWLSANFTIGDWQLYGLMTPPAGYYWTRYYNDALLVDRYGVVYDGAYGIDWDRYDDGYAYDDSYGYGEPDGPPPAYGAGYPAPAYGGSSSYYEESRDYRPAPLPPVVAPNVTYRAGYAGTYYTPPGTTTTIVIPGATTTTTTTEYITETYAPRPVVRKVYRAPMKKWRPRVRCTCSCGCR